MDMTDQWTLNRRNFAGHWQGCGSWFERDGSGRLDLQHPTRRIDPTTYAITFSDDDHGVWDGSGLAFAPGGKATYPISRATYNAGGCLLYTSPSPRDATLSRMPSSA